MEISSIKRVPSFTIIGSICTESYDMILTNPPWQWIGRCSVVLPRDPSQFMCFTISALLALCPGNTRVTGEFPHKGQWRWALMFSLICSWTNGRVNNRGAGDLILHRAHYDVTVMVIDDSTWPFRVLSHTWCDIQGFRAMGLSVQYWPHWFQDFPAI